MKPTPPPVALTIKINNDKEEKKVDECTDTQLDCSLDQKALEHVESEAELRMKADVSSTPVSAFLKFSQHQRKSYFTGSSKRTTPFPFRRETHTVDYHYRGAVHREQRTVVNLIPIALSPWSDEAAQCN
ncbi:unnamed protein product [Cylicostephanus goldi]|uniref:Uncharacterized protein n=1 Tax=Cylicostephanus goldi TaxID=71465 RepID=A0A3P6S1J1_CYLGO|nr:unnamed protein product [Cylicostephanus goldi]